MSMSLFNFFEDNMRKTDAGAKHTRGKPVNVSSAKRRLQPRALGASTRAGVPRSAECNLPGRGPFADTVATVNIESASAASAQHVTFHPLADIFPQLAEDRLQELARDIEAHGLLNPIVLHDGKILDGRCRYLACQIAGVEPRFEDYAGADPLGFVVSCNLHRRHLNESQRAMVAARLADLQRGANQYSAGLPLGAASDLMNVGARSVARAREVLVHGDPKLVKAVESGDLTVTAAVALSRNQAAASSDDGEIKSYSPTLSTNESALPVVEPSPSTSTMIEAASVQAGSLALLPSGGVLCRPTFELPRPGVTFLVGGLMAAVMEVAVKIGATVSAGHTWPNYHHAEIGDVVWLTSQARAEDILRCKFEAAMALLPNVRFLDPEFDGFGLSIRNLSHDLPRLDHAIVKDGPVKAVVLDHFSEYLRYGDTARTIRGFERAANTLQDFAVKHGAAVVLPCQLTARDEGAVAEAISAFDSLRTLQAVNAVFLIKRDVKPNRGMLVHVKGNLSLDGPGFPFQLRNRNCVPAVVWDGLS
jgi:hypothetical protein